MSTQQWLNANGGAFVDAGNWSAGVVPGSGDTAAFALGQSGTVSLAGDSSIASLAVNDPAYKVQATATIDGGGVGSLAIAGTLNVGVNGSGALTLANSDARGFSAGSATVAQLGNGTLTVRQSGLSIAGALRLGSAATASNPNLSIAQLDVRGSRVTAGSIDLNIAGATLDDGTTLATTGMLDITNSSILTIRNADTQTGSLVVGSTSNSSQAKLDVAGYTTLNPPCPAPGFLETGPLTVSAVGSTDPGSITVEHSTITTSGPAVIGASRTTGTASVTLVGFLGSPPCGPVPADWNIAGPLTVGRNGGVASLDLSVNAHVTATDAQVGFGVDPATGAPSGGTVKVHDGASLTLSGSLGLAVNVGGHSGGAYVQVGPGDVTLSVGQVVTIGGNSTLDLEGSVVHAGSINNSSGTIRGYGVI